MCLVTALPRATSTWNTVLRTICNDIVTVSLPQSVPCEEWIAIRLREADRAEYRRLAILGDAILRSILTTRLYEFEDLRCAAISPMNSVLQSNLVLAMLAEKSDEEIVSCAKRPSILNVVRKLFERDERGEKVTLAIPKGNFKPMADRFEAVLGLLYNISGDVARQRVLTMFEPLIAAALAADALAMTLTRSSADDCQSQLPDTAQRTPRTGLKRLREEPEEPMTSAKRAKADNTDAVDESKALEIHSTLPKKSITVQDQADVVHLTVDNAPNKDGRETLYPIRRRCRFMMIDLSRYDFEYDSDWSGGNRSEMEYEDGESDVEEDDSWWSESCLDDA